MRYLSNISGNPLYEEESMKIYHKLNEQNPENGLYRIDLDGISFKNTGMYKLGAFGDSFYEYILKLWLQKSKSENYLLDMYKNAINGIHNELLYMTQRKKILYIIEKSVRPYYKMDELVCFMPGTLILGAYTIPNYENKERDINTAKELMYYIIVL